MHINTKNNIRLEEVWDLIIERLGSEAAQVCPNSSSFYKTQDGIECSLRKRNGDLIGICYRETNKLNGYRWTIEKK
tara:strand:+ start:3206 stop:3433 length:228 start_codon:yes stop_codon:yes gene_type:complete